MSASFQSSVSAANSPAGLEQALSRAVQDLAAHRGWRLMNRTSSAVAFQVGVNWFSWGEAVTIDIQGQQILIRSRCRFPLQVIDWGKNRKNVSLVASSLTRSLAV
jgi:hypothetical protein